MASSADPSSDLLGATGHHPLRPIFRPRSVAVIGASDEPRSVGRTLLWNLISSPFGGTVHPVNHARDSVLGIRAHRRVGDVPERVDLAVIATPAPTVPGVVAECVEAGARAAVIISAGFRETGAAGRELERQVLDHARAGRMRIVGPNCLGVMNPTTGLNATFAAGIARPGSVGFVSQSGALLTAILDWADREAVGFSAVLSLGSMVDVGWGDVIEYLGDDAATRSIVIYMETIGNARSFLSAAREVAATKPIVVIKPGRSEAAARAAASHTGSLAGSDDVLAAAFRRVGVLRVDTVSDLFHMAEVLENRPRPRGRRLAIVTNAGGPGVIATDALIAGGGELAALGPHTIEALDDVLPDAWSHGNPVDILGDADPDRYARAVDIVRADDATDGLLVILTPQAMTDATATAELLAARRAAPDRPLLASWMGADAVAGGDSVLRGAGIPTFPYPDVAAAMFNYVWRHAENLRLLYETPVLADLEGDDAAGRARALLDAARGQGRTLLTEVEAKQVLAAYGIPVVDTRRAVSADEAVAAAEALGYPVAVKLHSLTITHKSDVGGVLLGLTDAHGVAAAYRSIEASLAEAVGPGHFDGVSVQPMITDAGEELIVGSSTDPQFGPVLLFGLGGRLVEVLRDREIGLPPLTTTLARRLMERTRVYQALAGVRGRAPVDLAALEGLLVRFSQLVVEQPAIAEIDINPLLASPKRLIALDARIVVHGPDVPDAALPRPAIRPYPRQLVGRWLTPDGVPLVIRPIRPEDEPLMVRFHESLSDETVYARYFNLLKLENRTAHERLARVCFIDYDRVMALVVEHTETGSGERSIVAVGRLVKAHGFDEGEFALLVADRWQRHGLGSELLRRLVEVGRAEGIGRIRGEILAGNTGMLRLARELGFAVRFSPGSTSAEAILDLPPSAGASSGRG
jgi:acetyltransferase